MDEKLIKQALHDIAQQGIPDDTPSLWPAIQQQASAIPQPASSPRFTHRLPAQRLAWIAVALVLSLMFSAGTYAFYRYQQNDDSGLEEVQNQGLITEIKQQKAQDGITVILDWAYADAHRIALGYSVSGGTVDMAPGLVGIGRLFDDQGREFPPMFGGGGGDLDSYQANANFDATIITGTPTTLNLRLELYAAPPGPPPTPQNTPDNSASDSGSGGGGGGGCGGNDAGEYECGYGFSGVSTDPRVFHPDAIGPFVFEFSVPFIPAVTFEPDETAAINGLAMTLESVSVTPSLTRVQLCYDTPDDSQPWTPVVTLNTGEQVLDQQASSSMPSSDSARRCYDLGFLAPYDQTAATWTLTVSHLSGWVNPDLSVLQRMFAEYGVRIKIEPQQGRWETTYVPEDVDFVAVMEAVFAELTPRIDGPWEFEIAVPGT